MGIEVTVIDDSDYVGWAAAATREGEIYMVNVQSMVDNVLRALQRHARHCTPQTQTNKLSRLNIIDHGNANALQIGSDWITDSSLPSFEALLSKLRGNFEADGFVHLQHCEIGNNRALLTKLARIWGCTVYAGTGLHNPLYRFNLGDYVRVDQYGRFSSDVSRP